MATRLKKMEILSENDLIGKNLLELNWKRSWAPHGASAKSIDETAKSALKAPNRLSQSISRMRDSRTYKNEEPARSSKPRTDRQQTELNFDQEQIVIRLIGNIHKSRDPTFGVLGLAPGETYMTARFRTNTLERHALFWLLHFSASFFHLNSFHFSSSRAPTPPRALSVTEHRWAYM